MHERLRSFVLVAAAASLVATPAAAQRVADIRGFHVGAGLNGSTIKLDEDNAEDSDRTNGGGLTLVVGYNFTRNIGIFLSGTGASMSDSGENYILGHGDFGARVSFPGTGPFVPYLEAAFTSIRAEDDIEGEKVELSGTGFTGAAGFSYFLGDKVALDLNVRYSVGEFNTVKIGGVSISSDDGVGYSSGRVNFGVAWYPMAGRGASQ